MNIKNKELYEKSVSNRSIWLHWIHISKKFLENGFTVLGIDALTDYYSVSLKKDRTKILKKYKNFEFINLNITNLNQITKVFRNFHPDIVLHFAAQ